MELNWNILTTLYNYGVWNILTTLGNYGALGVIAYYYIKGNKKREEFVETIVNDKMKDKIPDLLNPTIENILIDNLKNYEKKNIEEHKELKDTLISYNEYFKEIKQELSDLYIVFKKGEDNSSKYDKYRTEIREEIANSLPYFSDENLRMFIVEQCSTFSNWVLASSKYMFNDVKSLELCLVELMTNCNNMRNKCGELLPQIICDLYYEQRLIDMNSFFEKIRNIQDDIVNNRVKKFIKTSIIFMQDNVSLLLNTYVTLNGGKENYKKDDNMDGLEELRRLEKK